MKKMLLTVIICLPLAAVNAQQKEGTVTYERTSQMMIHINENDQAGQNLPQSHTDKFELVFANNQSLWHIADEQRPGEELGGGIQIRMVGGGNDDISFFDFSKGTNTDQREMFDKKFVIADSIHKMSWKLTGESKRILDHDCQKAVTQRIGIRTMMNMDNGKLERKEITDTSAIVAWFTADIPVPAGPAEFQGQLPGLILEMDISNGRQTFKATAVSLLADKALLKEPQRGKKVTRDEFKKETNLMMAEMEKNNGDGNRRVRFNN